MTNVPRPDKTPEEVQVQIGRILGNNNVTKSTLKRVSRILTRYHQDSSQKIIQLQIDHDALKYLTQHDTLTGLINRRAIDTEMKNTIDWNQDVVFMIFDLRKFKYINDTYGHAMGDNALKLFADVCRDFCIMYGGFIARTGGDEFMWFFPDKSLQDWRDMAQVFRQLLANKFNSSNMKHNSSSIWIEDIPFEAAIGVTSLRDENGIERDENGSIKQIPQKEESRVMTELEKLISNALWKADKMAEVAKNAENGIVSEWKDEYSAKVIMSSKNIELRNQFEWILRHWISDDMVPENIRQIRKLLLPCLDFHESFDDIRALLKHIKDLTRQSKYHLSAQFSNELEWLADFLPMNRVDNVKA